MAEQNLDNSEKNSLNGDPEVVEIESLCMNCHADGMTRLMATKIPFYREVVIMSFSCESCGFENNELQSCGVISDVGIKIVLQVCSSKDLNRKCVRTEYATISIPEVELEISSKNQKGAVSTIEGVIDRVISGLQQDQVSRRIEHPDDAYKIDQYIIRLEKLKNVEENGPFSITIEDISGNSYIENPLAPKKDDKMTVSYFKRTSEQNHEIGFFTREEVNDCNEDGENPVEKIDGMKDTLLQPIKEGEHTLEDFQHGEVLTFRTNCPNCNAPCDTNMKMTNIPHFKEVVIMATVCDYCGSRTNEVKSGGGIEKQGMRLEIKVRDKMDFSRDILKSDTCSLIVPELELESGPRSLCGRFTTVEGLLCAMKEQLAGKDSVLAGDSADQETVDNFQSFFKKFDQVLEGKMSVTLILDDPAGNSYIQTFNDDGTPDEGLTITRYDRNYDQNEELGLNDLKIVDY